MRDYGKVPTGFWRSGPGKVLRGDQSSIILALYLSSCPASTMTGLYYLPLVTICHETGLSEAEVRRALDRLAAGDVAHYDADAELVWVPDMAREEVGHALSAGDKRIKGIVKALEAYRGHRFRDEFLARYGAAYGLTEAPSKPLPSSLEAPSEEHQSPIEGPSEEHRRPSEAPPKPLRSQKQDQKQDQYTHTPHARARVEPPSSAEVRPVLCPTPPRPGPDAPPPTARSQPPPALPELGPEVAAVVAELQRHEVIALAARAVPAGEERARVALAEQIAGNAIASGKLLAWVIAAVGQAASELAAESAGVPLQWGAVVRRIRIFSDHARAPQDDGPSPPGAELRAGDGARRGTPPTEDERALVGAYCEIRKRRGYGDVVPLDLHYGAARRMLPDLRKLEANAKPRSRGSPALTWLEIARHRLEAFFRDADAKLEAAGFPLDWLLHRTDAAGLPPQQKPAEKPAPMLAPVDAETHRAAARQALATLGLPFGPPLAKGTVDVDQTAAVHRAAARGAK